MNSHMTLLLIQELSNRYLVLMGFCLVGFFVFFGGDDGDFFGGGFCFSSLGPYFFLSFF